MTVSIRWTVITDRGLFCRGWAMINSMIVRDHGGIMMFRPDGTVRHAAHMTDSDGKGLEHDSSQDVPDDRRVDSARSSQWSLVIAMTSPNDITNSGLVEKY